jgi:hypothetical protein
MGAEVKDCGSGLEVMMGERMFNAIYLIYEKTNAFRIWAWLKVR